jgi:hypothetical protein
MSKKCFKCGSLSYLIAKCPQKVYKPNSNPPINYKMNGRHGSVRVNHCLIVNSESIQAVQSPVVDCAFKVEKPSGEAVNANMLVTNATPMPNTELVPCERIERL